MESSGKIAHNFDDDEKSAAEKADSLRLEGNESFRVNDFKKAVELYTKSLEAKKTVPALLNRSFSYTKMERFEEALSDADEALEMDPTNLKGKCRRGIALRELGRYSLALKEFGDCLEVDSQSSSFQQLYDQCQALLDEKSFVDMKLRILGYNKNPKSGTSELMKLELVDGLHGPHTKQKAQSFQSLHHLEAYIKDHVKGRAFYTIRIENTSIDEELMQFFRSLDPGMLAPVYLEFFNVGCSSAQFAELFGGGLLQPLSISLSGIEGTEIDLTAALHSLAAMRSAKILDLKEYYSGVDGVSLKKNSASSPLDVDTVLELLHQPYPDIPAHIRASSFIVERRISSFADSALRGEHPLTALENVAMFRRMAGRIIDVDLAHFGTGGKLAEIIQKCTQRFQSTQSSVSYMLILHVPLSKGNFPSEDNATLSGLIQRGVHIPYNGVGEKLTVCVMPEEFEGPGDPEGRLKRPPTRQVVVQRVLRAPPAPNR